MTTRTNEIVLFNRPEREEMPHCTSVKDFGLVINYYESLVQSWELWGNDTIEILNNSGFSVSEIKKE